MARLRQTKITPQIAWKHIQAIGSFIIIMQSAGDDCTMYIGCTQAQMCRRIGAMRFLVCAIGNRCTHTHTRTMPRLVLCTSQNIQVIYDRNKTDYIISTRCLPAFLRHLSLTSIVILNAHWAHSHTLIIPRAHRNIHSSIYQHIKSKRIQFQCMPCVHVHPEESNSQSHSESIKHCENASVSSLLLVAS